MAKFHLNYKGEPGVCSAKVNCPFGGEQDHFPSAQAARDAYEELMANHVSMIGKKSLKASVTVEFNEVKDDLVKEIQALEQLALGKNHGKALQSLNDAKVGKPSSGFRGGRRGINPLDMIELLTKAKREIGPKGNPDAYGRVTKLIDRLETTKEILADPYYQGTKAMKTAKLPVGAKRVYDKNFKRNSVKLADGTVIDWSVVRDKPYYYTRGSTTLTRKASFDLSELAHGGGDAVEKFRRENFS